MQDVALRGHWLGGLSSGAAQVSPLLPQALTGSVIMEGPEISATVPSPSSLKVGLVVLVTGAAVVSAGRSGGPSPTSSHPSLSPPKDWGCWYRLQNTG